MEAIFCYQFYLKISIASIMLFRILCDLSIFVKCILFEYSYITSCYYSLSSFLDCLCFIFLAFKLFADEDVEELVPSSHHGKSTGTVLPFVGVACLGAILFGYHLG